jgi:hypothetical protein
MKDRRLMRNTPVVKDSTIELPVDGCAIIFSPEGHQFAFHKSLEIGSDTKTDRPGYVFIAIGIDISLHDPEFLQEMKDIASRKLS